MKKITSLTLGISFLIMSYTGIMLFLCPHGRVAYWSDWHLWGLSKTDYGNLHTTSMLLFLFFGILHIYYNWKAIVSYLKNKQKKISFTKKEFLIALSINILFVVGTLSMLQPFKVYLEFEEGIKDSWTKNYGEPPYGHAEETKLNVLCQKMGIDLKKAKVILAKNGIDFKENESLKIIGKNNDLAPSEIYKLIEVKKENKDTDAPASLGRKTLQELESLGKVPLKKSLEFFKEKGLKDVSPQSRIKNLADELTTTPLELYEVLKK